MTQKGSSGRTIGPFCTSLQFLENIHTAVITAHAAIIRANKYTTIQANRRRRASTFAVGDLVLLSTRNIVSDTYTGARSLMPKFCGPFAIAAKINDVTNRLDLSLHKLFRGIHNAFHAKPLRPYHPDTAFDRTTVAPPPIQFPNGHTEYEGQTLVRYRLHRGNPQYLVHSKGYGDYETSWVPAVDLTCPELLADFHRAAGGSSKREDDDRFHLSISMYRYATYRYATFWLHFSFPHIPLPCDLHHNT
jgi:hypothetical protein